jgi:hypothetical protein
MPLGPEARMSWPGRREPAFVDFAYFFVPFVEAFEAFGRMALRSWR